MQKIAISEAVQNLRNALHANLDWEVQFLDVKYLIDLEHEYRGEVKKLISTYRTWKKATEKQRDVRVLIFSRLKGQELEKSIKGYLEVYKTVRAERRFLTDVYVGQLKKGRR